MLTGLLLHSLRHQHTTSSFHSPIHYRDCQPQYLNVQFHKVARLLQPALPLSLIVKSSARFNVVHQESPNKLFEVYKSFKCSSWRAQDDNLAHASISPPCLKQQHLLKRLPLSQRQSLSRFLKVLMNVLHILKRQRVVPSQQFVRTAMVTLASSSIPGIKLPAATIPLLCLDLTGASFAKRTNG